jgi:hypothetical protein
MAKNKNKNKNKNKDKNKNNNNKKNKNESKKFHVQFKFFRNLKKWYRRHFGSRGSSDIHIDLGSKRK